MGAVFAEALGKGVYGLLVPLQHATTDADFLGRTGLAIDHPPIAEKIGIEFFGSEDVEYVDVVAAREEMGETLLVPVGRKEIGDENAHPGATGLERLLAERFV